jgi:hypothetical protein
MRFAFVAKHRSIWPVAWLCEAMDVSRSGFHAWLNRSPSKRTLEDEALLSVMRQSFTASDRTYGARRIWHDVLAEGFNLGLHRIERLMRENAMRARPRRRYLPPDTGQRMVSAIAPNVLDRQFHAAMPNSKWIADFTYIWTAEGWLYVAAVIDLFSRRECPSQTAQSSHERPRGILFQWEALSLGSVSAFLTEHPCVHQKTLIEIKVRPLNFVAHSPALPPGNWSILDWSFPL